MGKFCGKCGKPLNANGKCSYCIPASTVQVSKPRASLDDSQAVVGNIGEILTGFGSKPVQVVYESAIRKNITAAVVVIVLTAIFKCLAMSSLQFENHFFSALSFEFIAKSVIGDLIQFAIVIVLVFFIVQFLYKKQNDILVLFTALGISMISFCAAYVLVFLLNMFYSPISYIILNAGKAFTLIAFLLAVKQIEKDNSSEALVYTAALLVAVYNLSGFIVSKLL